MPIPKSRADEIASIPDAAIDTSDIPEADEDFFKKAKLVEPTTLPPWAGEVINAGMQEPGDAARVNMIAQMQEIARSGDVSQIDDVLDHVDVQALHEISLITLLRGTYSFSSRLQNWSAFRDRVGVELDRRGLDRDKILAGLIDEPNPALNSR
jgi:hypothetical protein